MKKIALATLIACAMSSVAMASPLTDYSKGNAALDITYRNTSTYDVDAKIDGLGNLDQLVNGISDGNHPNPLRMLSGKTNVEWGFTYGIGNNWALQYRQATPKGSIGLPSDHPSFSQDVSVSLGLEAKTRVEEYNILYKMDKNFSLFTGMVKATPSLKASLGLSATDQGDNWNGISSVGGNLAIQGHDKNIWHFGVIATAPVAKKLTAYGIASFGGDYRNWEAGLGYQIDKNLEFNVNYRDMKVSNKTIVGVSVNDTNYDVKTDSTVKGWGFGITYKF